MAFPRRPQQGETEYERALARNARDDIRRTHADPMLRWVMTVLTVLIVLGVASTALTIVNNRSQNAAQAADVKRAADLSEQLRAAQIQSSATSAAYRDYLSAQLSDICAKITSIAEQAKLPVGTCITPPPNPKPTPTPTS